MVTPKIKVKTCRQYNLTCTIWAMITQEELKRQLSYDPETGIMRWIIAKPRIHIGMQAGNLHCKGHRELTINGRSYREHRLIWKWVTGEDPGKYVDHRDRVRDHNWWTNLRLATHGENYVNSLQFGEMRGIVQRGKNSFRVRIGHGGFRRVIDGIRTLEEAKALRRKLEVELYGEFACERSS